MKQSTSTLYLNWKRFEPISWFTCYYYFFGTAPNSSKSEVSLVGDSDGMLALAYYDFFPARMNEMIAINNAVKRQVSEKFNVGDRPKRSHEALNYKD